eukprot:comp7152_c1_seq1/m.2875 comp7152_c1_seq1/g.2875  ORF comp7152_c1_seq1/g.2875 comp7152_c1_seq1/m.2875 type:complete len:277 (-) comp7152_c1_seq1:105-935(-)
MFCSKTLDYNGVRRIIRGLPRKMASVTENGKIGSKRLLAFDFDWTLIDLNSDTHVIEALSKKVYNETIGSKGHGDVPSQWTDLMDFSLLQLHANGFGKEDVERVLASIRLHQDMIHGLNIAAADGTDIHIISDANIVFIDRILKANGIDHLFAQIATNPAVFDSQGALRVQRLTPPDQPHGCPMCALNMCKGNILEGMIRNQSYSQVVYVGDGANDCCPAMRLKSGDVVLARKGFRLERALAENRDRVAATVHLWENYPDLLECLQGFYGHRNDGQ